MMKEESTYKIQKNCLIFPTTLLLTVILYVSGIITLYVSHLYQISNFPCFVFMFFLHLLINPPKQTISPLGVLYGYYGLWYVVAPAFAERYQENTRELPEYTLAIVMAYIVFGAGLIAIRLGEITGLNSRVNTCGHLIISQRLLHKLKRWSLLLYAIATLSIWLIIINTDGGIAKWIVAPGDAFLNRGGTGVYVIISHFSSWALAALCGYYAYITRKKSPLVLFLLWLILTSPIHGSKLQIALLGIILFIPWIKDMRLFSIKSQALVLFLLLVFVLGLYFRNLSWIDVSSFLPYALNYFTALANLALSIRDFDPGFLTTFFLPFMKFTTPFGISDANLYYDMNHLLTDHYFPEAWEIRATEQWPVETDLYLNFFFVGGVPLVVVYFFVVGFIYGYGLKANTLGWLFVGVFMTVGMISHLRGSLINHTDFYIYPYLLLIVFLFRKFHFPKMNSKSTNIQIGKSDLSGI